MQNLNSRLSAYMDKVAALEDSNEELEEKIRNWYETNKPKDVDNSKYYKTIEDLNDQISDATKDYNQLTVEVENARLAADDFRGKYEMELNMRQEVEMDIEELRKALDDLTLEKASLEGQVEDLTEEIALNKKNHEEAMKALRGQKSDVVVQVDAAPGINILKVLNDIRSQYEDMAEENRRKAEEEYNQKLAELNNEISYSSAEAENGKAELAELRRTVQTMEIDLQSQLAMKCSLENALAETQIRYARQLAQIQQMVSNLEEQLAQVRSEMENESCKYNQLLDIKTRLESEIEMYRSLVDGEGGSSSGSGSGGSSSARVSSRVSTSVSGSGTPSGSSSTSRRGFSNGSNSGSGSGSTSGFSSGSISGSGSGFSSGSTNGSGSGFSSGSTSGTIRGSSSGFSSGSTSGATKGSSSGFSSGSSSGLSSGSTSGATKGSSSGFSSGSSSGITSGSNGSSYGSSGAERRSDSPSVPEPAKRRLVTTLTEERVDRRLVTTMGPKKA
ncbi:keratin, type I cytoskeletal 10-like [Hyla sarda]|uniref:keratin, type I cytoskeletal 10-like n=1 Tax=Hyla sarda TaxID=327740 RepID=UPI0024C3DE65|nr:keratin, type I cytoskeletal 10-like [Hyla sarda]